MSQLKVEICEIKKVDKHPNADRLDLLTVKGWQCIATKGAFKAGDKVVYFPIDSILPPDVEHLLFPPDAKVKLHNSRVRTIKIRGEVSQGLAIHPAELGCSTMSVGADVTVRFGVLKWEPPVKGSPQSNCKPKKKKDINPNFREYTDIQHLKNYPDAFREQQCIVVSEKVHGTNFRAGYVTKHPRNLFQKLAAKLRDLFRLKPSYEFVYGSRRVQLQWKKNPKTFYNENIYWKTVEKYNLCQCIDEGVVIYGEIYGDKVQRGYNYGLVNEQRLVVFDVMLDGKYFDDFDARIYCEERGLPFVPLLYLGSYNGLDPKLVSGRSHVCPDQKVREGIVIRPCWEEYGHNGRKIFKWVNPDYLLKEDNTEWQ